MNIWYFHHYATPAELPGLHRPFEFGIHFNNGSNKTAVFTSSYLHYSGDNIISNKEKLVLKNYDGIDTVFVKTCGYENKINRILNMLQFAIGLFRSAKWFANNQWKPDVIVASSPHPLTMIAGIKIAKKLDIPCICEVRDFWPEVFFLGGILKEKSLLGKLLLSVEKHIYEKADKLVFLKEGDHTYITDHKWDKLNGGKIDIKKCAYINNGVDIELFDKHTTDCKYDDSNLSSDQFNVVYCGTIRPVNNIGMLLDVAKLVKDVNFLIFGTGNCEKELKQRLIDENITNVYFKGYVENKYIPSILSKSSLNILNYSSNNYNWSRGNSSNKLFEYLASSKPVVSTVKMGYDIIEKYNCGYSVEVCSAENVAKLINKIKTLPNKEYSKMCINARKAAEHFDIPHLAKDYLEELNQTIANYKGKNK